MPRRFGLDAADHSFTERRSNMVPLHDVLSALLELGSCWMRLLRRLFFPLAVAVVCSGGFLLADAGADSVPPRMLLDSLGGIADSYRENARKWTCTVAVRDSRYSGGIPKRTKEREYSTILVIDKSAPFGLRSSNRPRDDDRISMTPPHLLVMPDPALWPLIFGEIFQSTCHFSEPELTTWHDRTAIRLPWTCSHPFRTGTTLQEWSGSAVIDTVSNVLLQVDMEPNLATISREAAAATRRQATELRFRLGGYGENRPPDDPELRAAQAKVILADQDDSVEMYVTYRMHPLGLVLPDRAEFRVRREGNPKRVIGVIYSRCQRFSTEVLPSRNSTPLH